MTLQQRKTLLFRMRLMMLYPVGLACIGYFQWLAPYLGAAHVQRMRHRLPQFIALSLLRLNGIRLQVQGLQHLAAAGSGPRVLVSNHNSRFDGYILLALCPFAYKSFWSDTAHVTAEGFGVVDRFGRAFDLFFVHDKRDVRATLREFKQAETFLRAGGALSFFPEGQFSRDGWVRDLGSACVSLAVRTAAPLLPLVMLDTQATFESRRRFWGAPQCVQVTVLPDIATASCSKADVPTLVAQVEGQMNQTLAAARQVPCPQRPGDTTAAPQQAA